MLTTMELKPLQFLLLMVIVTETIVPVHGLRCYNCDSTSNRDVCGADFKLTSSNTSFIVDNCGYCIKYRFANDRIYFRTCSEKEDYSFKLGCDTCRASGTRVRSCYCNEDLCNGATSRLPAVPVITLVWFSVYTCYNRVTFDLI